jgi:CheY-like chemotaxis protein
MPVGPRLDGVLVLVVEDSPDASYVVEQTLRRFGATVMTADCAAAALRIVEDSPPDVLLSDIGLPGMDGYALLKQIRQMEEQRHLAAVPAVAVTAFTSSEHLSKSIAAGFQRHIPKPFEMNVLITTVADLTKKV